MTDEVRVAPSKNERPAIPDRDLGCEGRYCFS